MKRFKLGVMVVLSIIALGVFYYLSTEDNVGINAANLGMNPLSYPISYAKNIKSNMPDIYFSKDNITYKLASGSNTPQEIAPVDGLISHNRQKVAFITKPSDSWYTDPYVYYYDLKTNTKMILVNTDSQKTYIVSSWSPDDRYIVLMNSTQYLGGSVYDIYDTLTNTKVAALNVYTNYKWLDNNEILYTDPECSSTQVNPNVCVPTASSISKLVLSTKVKIKIKKYGGSQFSEFRIKDFNQSTNQAVVSFILDNSKKTYQTGDLTNLDLNKGVSTNVQVNQTNMSNIQNLLGNKSDAQIEEQSSTSTNQPVFVSTDEGNYIGSYINGNLQMLVTGVSYYEW